MFEGIWWAAATVTTVGYGDKAPTKVGGRSVAMGAMFASLFLVGGLVSEVSRDLAIQQATVASIDDDQRVVAVVTGSTFADFIESQGVETLRYDTQAAAFAAADHGDADAVLASPFALLSLGLGMESCLRETSSIKSSRRSDYSRTRHGASRVLKKRMAHPSAHFRNHSLRRRNLHSAARSVGFGVLGVSRLNAAERTGVLQHPASQ